VIGAIAVWVVLLWLSSRGSFMFLDNVVHNRAEVKEPWRRFKALGDSLFLWRFVFSLICFLVFGGLAALAVLVCLPMIGSGSAAAVSIPALIVLGCTILMLGVLTAFVDFFLMHCVVPVMYKHDIKVTKAWRRFLRFVLHAAEHLLRNSGVRFGTGDLLHRVVYPDHSCRGHDSAPSRIRHLPGV
jgi:hypothetical protein